MKVYRVKVNGKVYEVELEAVSEVKGSVEVNTNSNTTVTSTNASSTIVAPIAGRVIDVLVKVGDKVTKGQTVAIVEAMKLENEVPSTCEGIVKEVKVSKGSNVNNNDVLVVLG